MRNYVLAPGIEVIENENRFELWIKHKEEPLIGWDFEEISKNPKSWISSIKAVITVITQGPVAVKNLVEKKKSEIKLAPDMLCMVCGRKINAINTNFCFSATLNGKNFRDYQCSAECNKKRKEQVLRQELGSDFIEKWAGKAASKS